MAAPDDSMIGATARFATTRWSVVLSAQRRGAQGRGAQGRAAQGRAAQGGGSQGGPSGPDSGEADAADDALAQLCATYWPAVYAYLRRRGHGREDARDLAQGFFATLLEKDWVARADAERGSFRAFLVTALRRYVAGEYERGNALRRGGGVRHVPLPAGDDVGTFEPASDDTPDRAFYVAWIRALLSRVLDGLRSEYVAMGQAKRFDSIEPHLVPGETPPFRAMAEELGIVESSCRVAVFRARRRYRELLRAEIGSTVGSMGAVDGELDALIAAGSPEADRPDRWGSSGKAETGGAAP